MFILAQRFLTFNSCHFNIITFLLYFFIGISESSLFKSKKTILYLAIKIVLFLKISFIVNDAYRWWAVILAIFYICLHSIKLECRKTSLRFIKRRKKMSGTMSVQRAVYDSLPNYKYVIIITFVRKIWNLHSSCIEIHKLFKHHTNIFATREKEKYWIRFFDWRE